ncbi:MAG TPA: hypothetical protein VHR66_11695 [Gemmataceae bacterium]|jgi:hypothetical protein|nr:hypothetical protein [Gemmataceae bacterium]
MIPRLAVAAVFLMLLSVGCSKKPGPNAVIVKPAAGAFELHMLANGTDDADAIAAAEQYFAKTLKDPELAAELKRRLDAGQPPPPPVVQGVPFIALGKPCTYRWAPVSEHALNSEQLEAKPDDQANTSERYTKLKGARERGVLFDDRGIGYSRDFGKIWWSRQRPNSTVVDYFLLVRESQADEDVGAEVTEVVWDPDVAKDGTHRLDFRLTAVGKSRLADMTTRNRPSGKPENRGPMRRLAILIRGRIVSSANLLTALTGDVFSLTGGFSSEDVKKLIDLMRGE